MKDFLGRELRVGDKIVYTTRQGSSMNLILAEVIENGGNRIKIQPSVKSRSKCIIYDERTGEDVPWREVDQHYARQAGWYNKDGVAINASEYYRMPSYDPRKDQYSYKPVVWNSYLKKRYKAADPVYLRAEYYIVKLEPFDEGPE